MRPARRKGPPSASALARFAAIVEETEIGAVADVVARRLLGQPADVIDRELEASMSDLRRSLGVAAGMRPLKRSAINSICAAAESRARARIERGAN